MTDNSIVSICKNIWQKRTQPFIWVDSESEITQPENLVYKRLDGLRAILLPLVYGVIRPEDLDFFNKKEFKEELTTLADFLAKDEQHFYPAPHVYTLLPQPDDYIDMASHSLCFSLHALKFARDNHEKQVYHRLIDKSLKCLSSKEHFYQDDKGLMAAWSGTIIYELPDKMFDVLSVYFTAQVLIVLSEWLKEPVFLTGTVDNELVNTVKELAKKGCRWMLSQDFHPNGLLVNNASRVKYAETDELITTNTAALTAIFRLWNQIDASMQQRAKELTEKFFLYLNSNRPENKDWSHQVATKQVGYQWYQDRQETCGVITFLGYAMMLLKKN